jgi:hypothetical protein
MTIYVSQDSLLTWEGLPGCDYSRAVTLRGLQYKCIRLPSYNCRDLECRQRMTQGRGANDASRQTVGRCSLQFECNSLPSYNVRLLG